VAGLKVSHLGLVTSLHQGVETSVDQLGNAAAQHGLLAEQVGLGLLLEGGLQDACTACTDAGSVCQSDVLGLTGVVLLHADQRGAALALGVQAAHDVAGALGSDHDDVHVLGSGDGLEVDVEAVCKGQSLALGHIRSNLLVVDVGAQLIGNQHHDHIAGLSSLFHFHDLEVVVGGSELGSLCPVSRTLAQADDDVDAALGQVFGVCMALTAKADDRDGLAVQHAEVAVGIVVFLDSHSSCSPFYSSVVANNKRSLFFRSPGSGKNIQVRSGQWVPGRGSWAARTSCGGFCICWCIPPRSSAVTPVRHCSRIS